MAKINLLPWRQAYREEKKREFVSILIGVFLLSCLVSYIWVSSVESAIENQNSRNAKLNAEIAKLELQVKEIAEIKKVRADLLARIKVIQDLEGTRPVIVRYFDDFVRAIPDGVFISSMDKKGNAITLVGVAESYNRVAAFMRNLDESEWFADPKLSSVTAAPAEGEQANSFRMTVMATQPELTSDLGSSPKTGVKK
ncbi:MAG: PilN domain-containing protein [Cellvibrio sp.]|nr:PilN domain-containing protein [Cellvibrio sp.]